MSKHFLTPLVLAAGLALGAGALSVTPAQAQAQTPAASPDQALIAKGQALAFAGDCAACHTAPGGQAFAGGLPIKSDLGTIFSTNITPDKQHGIGNYTEAQFAAALRDGIRADGSHLYPAMPYPSYSKVTDEDVHALYAYFMNDVKPVAESAPQTALKFPFSQRWGMAFWNMAFSSTGTFKPSPQASAEINRGAYLVEGLGHCGSCHTPRGFGMQEVAYDASGAKYLTGSVLNGWAVPSLRTATNATKGIASWNVDEIVDYLATGRNNHAAVGGEMKTVIEDSTSHMSQADLHAIAVYLKSITSGSPTPVPADKVQATTAKLTAAKDLTPGERLYLDNCGACHFATGQGSARVFPALDGASLVNAQNPTGLLKTILGGAQTPSTPISPSILPMPAFAKRLSNQQVAELATFLRSGWSNNAPAVTAQQVSEARQSLDQH